MSMGRDEIVKGLVEIKKIIEKTTTLEAKEDQIQQSYEKEIREESKIPFPAEGDDSYAKEGMANFFELFENVWEKEPSAREVLDEPHSSFGMKYTTLAQKKLREQCQSKWPQKYPLIIYVIAGIITANIISGFIHFKTAWYAPAAVGCGAVLLLCALMNIKINRKNQRVMDDYDAKIAQRIANYEANAAQKRADARNPQIIAQKNREIEQLNIEIRKKNEQIHRKNAQLAEKEKEVLRILEDLDNTLDGRFWWYPDDYLYHKPVDFFIDAFNKGMADTLKEAINLYEADERERKFQAQILKEMKEKEKRNIAEQKRRDEEQRIKEAQQRKHEEDVIENVLRHQAKMDWISSVGIDMAVHSAADKAADKISQTIRDIKNK